MKCSTVGEKPNEALSTSEGIGRLVRAFLSLSPIFSLDTQSLD